MQAPNRCGQIPDDVDHGPVIKLHLSTLQSRVHIKVKLGGGLTKLLRYKIDQQLSGNPAFKVGLTGRVTVVATCGILSDRQSHVLDMWVSHWISHA